MKAALVSLFLCLAQPLSACEIALLLTMDVSNSIDLAEYRLEVDGLADALLDGEVIDVIVQGQSALAVMQWPGEGRQTVSIPWTRLRSGTDVRAFAAQALACPGLSCCRTPPPARP